VGYGNAILGKFHFYGLPKVIAKSLNLANPELYTGHSILRTAATWLANEGYSTLQMQKFGRWKSASVAQGYVDNSTVAKENYATSIAKTDFSVQNDSNQSRASKISFSGNCSFSQCNFYVNSEPID
jgi:hypothetical protein